MNGSMKRRKHSRKTAGAIAGRFALLLALAGIFACHTAYAADFSVFGGTEVDGRGQGYSYAAIDATQKINSVFSVSARIMPNYLTYKYYSGDRLIKAKSPGVDFLGGIKASWGRTSFSVYGGVETRNTSLSPDDPYASVSGHTTEGVIQGEFDTWIARGTNFNIFGSYSGTSNFSYEKSRIKQQVSNWDSAKPYMFYVGLEQFYGRNVDFNGMGVGPVVEFVYMPQKLSVALIGGYKHDSTFGDGAYWGLQVYKGF
jgi:hypothetical protein